MNESSQTAGVEFLNEENNLQKELTPCFMKIHFAEL